MPEQPKSDDYWNGAITAFDSLGHDSKTIRNMIVNMGCDPEEADAHCCIDDED